MRTLYEIRIGAKGQEPRLRFCDYASSTFEAIEQNLWQREEGDRVEAFPVGEKPEAFAVQAVRNELACSELREVQHTDAYHRVNDREAMRLQQQHLDAMRRCGAL